MISHPIAETLIAYAAGELSSDEFNAVTDHATACGQCRATIERYRLLNAVLRAATKDTTRLPVPPRARAKAIALYRDRFRHPRLGLSDIARLLQMKMTGETKVTLLRLLAAVVVFFFNMD